MGCTSDSSSSDASRVHVLRRATVGSATPSFPDGCRATQLRITVPLAAAARIRAHVRARSSSGPGTNSASRRRASTSVFHSDLKEHGERDGDQNTLE